MQERLSIGDQEFSSRLLVGTGKFSSGAVMKEAIQKAGAEIATVALKRMDLNQDNDPYFLQYLDTNNITLLPNTSGARTAREAILAAEMGREALQTNWVKLEIHPDAKYLMPDPEETLLAARELVKKGFVVLPYVHADPVLCKKLEDAGTAAVMPLGSPIGSNQGLQARSFIEMIIEQSTIPVIVDAGIGAPSHAAEAMEMGADAVLVNTALAISNDPAAIAGAFRQAVEAGRTAWETGLSAKSNEAVATSPLTAFLEN